MKTATAVQEDCKYQHIMFDTSWTDLASISMYTLCYLQYKTEKLLFCVLLFLKSPLHF